MRAERGSLLPFLVRSRFRHLVVGVDFPIFQSLLPAAGPEDRHFFDALIPGSKEQPLIVVGKVAGTAPHDGHLP